MSEQDDLPKIGAPATRALANVGVTSLDQVAEWSETDLLALHGVGPKAVRILKESLSARGMALK
ncbi:helix-hairpin-helix domain-containing protein [Leucobacter sp. UT-8R-CII-1-4]|uniref:helix-hairpin-helix domain-containing protein n=1 Tax=Leucobacter sp. UT-8R-CII-1-4 TaxID=3040075 RepID=UPI0024A813A8|nr:helix-hairpin-helix domain-containing protein [Leucobacter sp. UT-8R-CII-1-4]MDI6024476.1 helix-hairpin-helix domain-containing protein [Leucobacter sp. UT-8R-CII-1-4]